MAGMGDGVGEAGASRWRDAMAASNKLWSAAVGATRDELTATTKALQERARLSLMLYVAAIVMAVMGVMALIHVVLRVVRGLLAELTKAMQELADGRLAVTVPGRERSDEIGVMATTVEVFKQNAVTMRKMEEERAEEKIRAEAEKQTALHRLADAFEGEVLGVVRTVAAAA